MSALFSDLLGALWFVLEQTWGLFLGAWVIMYASLGSVRQANRAYFGLLGLPYFWLRCRLHRQKDDGHIVAYKWAYPIWKDDKAAFFPMRIHPTYGVDATAVCKHGGIRTGTRCECGFYSLKYARHLGYIRGSQPSHESHYQEGFCVTLQVDLSGKVIEGTFGYRAEKQRVLKVSVPKYCRFCYHGKLRHIPAADGVIIADGRTIATICSGHGVEPKPLSWLADQLGTEVVWTRKRPVV